MRLIDADALRFKNVAEVNGILTHILTADEINSTPTISNVREVHLKDLDEDDKRAFINFLKANPVVAQITFSDILNDDRFTIEELRSWLYQIAINNTPSDFEKDVVEIIQRLDGFERFCKERRAGT